MHEPRLAEELAPAIHQAWCTHMKSQGWREGTRYDPATKEHDAIAPFGSLDSIDREHALAVAGEVVESVLDEFDYDRGPEREFRAHEMAVDRPVVLARRQNDNPAHGWQVEERGVILSWEPGAAPDRLSLIRVRWSDGQTVEYQPAALELCRPEEIEASTRGPGAN